MAPAPAIDVLTCPECDQPITPKGKQTAAMALGYHRFKEHGVAGSHARRSKKAVRENSPKASGAASSPMPPGPEEPTPLAVVHSITDPITGKGAPTQGQLTAALGKGYGYLMLWRTSRLVERDPRLTDDQRVEMIERIAPAESTCESVASPFARVIARTKLNKTAGRAVVDNIDILDCFVALLESERALASYGREVRAVVAGQQSGQVATLVPPAPAAAGATIPPGTGSDYYAYSDGPRSPAPAEGRVIGAADVAASLGVTLDLPPDVNTGTASPIPPSMEVTQ